MKAKFVMLMVALMALLTSCIDMDSPPPPVVEGKMMITGVLKCGDETWVGSGGATFYVVTRMYLESVTVDGFSETPPYSIVDVVMGNVCGTESSHMYEYAITIPPNDKKVEREFHFSFSGPFVYGNIHIRQDRKLK